jgi:hypothetical protein
MIESEEWMVIFYLGVNECVWLNLMDEWRSEETEKIKAKNEMKKIFIEIDDERLNWR